MILAFVADPNNNMTLGSTVNGGSSSLTYVAPPPSLTTSSMSGGGAPTSIVVPSRSLATSITAPLAYNEIVDSRHLQQPPFEPLKMMKAIHVENFGGPDVLQLKSNLIVPPLTKTQVLIRVKCAGVNPVETYIREGQYSRQVYILCIT